MNQESLDQGILDEDILDQSILDQDSLDQDHESEPRLPGHFWPGPDLPAQVEEALRSRNKREQMHVMGTDGLSRNGFQLTGTVASTDSRYLSFEGCQRTYCVFKRR